jgi:hypothetical protein
MGESNSTGEKPFMGTKKSLKQIAAEMTVLCAAIPKTNSLTKKERAVFSDKVRCAVEVLEMDYGIPVFRPVVPKATQAMFFKLYVFLGYDLVG